MGKPAATYNWLVVLLLVGLSDGEGSAFGVMPDGRKALTFDADIAVTSNSASAAHDDDNRRFIVY